MEETEEMGNYMQFLAKKITGRKHSAGRIDIITQAFLYILTVLSVVLNTKAGLIY